MKGIDYTGSTTLVQAKALKAAGYGFVCRYLVPVRMAWKRLTKAEVDILTSVDLQIVSVYEAAADGARKGATQGIADGKEAFAEAKLVGQPLGSTIYFAVDYDATAVDYASIEAYLKAAQTQIPGYNAGVYGEYTVCEEMFKRGVKFCWQTYAWSAGKKSTHANVWQYHNGATICGIPCDENESFGGEGFWNLKPKAVTPDYKALYLDAKAKLDALTAASTKKVTEDKAAYDAMKKMYDGLNVKYVALRKQLIALGNAE